MPGPQLRPLTVGEIVDGAIKLVTGNARVLFTIAAVILVPLGIIQLAAYAAFGAGDVFASFYAFTDDPELITPEEAEAALGGLFQLLALTVAISFVAWVGSVLVTGATVKAAADVYQGAVPSWQDSLGQGLRFLGAILVATLSVGLVAGFGLLLCLVPGVWLFTSWAVTIPAIVVEGRGPFAAMKRSFQLVKPKFWATLGVVLLAAIMYGVVSYAIGLLGSLFTFADPLGPASLVASVISSTIASIIVLPFLACVLIVLYFDLRVRAEGYDLEVMARELGDTAPGTRAPDDPDDPFGLGSPGGR